MRCSQHRSIAFSVPTGYYYPGYSLLLFFWDPRVVCSCILYPTGKTKSCTVFFIQLAVRCSGLAFGSICRTWRVHRKVWKQNAGLSSSFGFRNCVRGKLVSEKMYHGMSVCEMVLYAESAALLFCRVGAHLEIVFDMLDTTMSLIVASCNPHRLNLLKLLTCASDFHPNRWNLWCGQ